MQPLDPLPPVAPLGRPRKPGAKKPPVADVRDGTDLDGADDSLEQEPEHKPPQDDEGHLVDEYA